MKKVLFCIALLFLLMQVSAATADLNSEQQMLADFVQTGNPALDLYNFAKDNNLSIQKAKKILKRNFGNPKISKEEYFNKIAKTQNPDEDLKAFARSHNLTNDEAKVILKQIFGEPKMF